MFDLSESCHQLVCGCCDLNCSPGDNLGWRSSWEKGGKQIDTDGLSGFYEKNI